jgi:putative endonuclease
MKEYCVYILKNDQHRYYVGSTSDLRDRLIRHNNGESLATRGRGPWRLVYRESYGTKSEAMKREYQIKRMKSRSYIQDLIEQEREKHAGA